MSLDFLEILGRRKKKKISQGGVWADLTPPFVTTTTFLMRHFQLQIAVIAGSKQKVAAHMIMMTNFSAFICKGLFTRKACRGGVILCFFLLWKRDHGDRLGRIRRRRGPHRLRVSERIQNHTPRIRGCSAVFFGTWISWCALFWFRDSEKWLVGVDGADSMACDCPALVGFETSAGNCCTRASYARVPS